MLLRQLGQRVFASNGFKRYLRLEYREMVPAGFFAHFYSRRRGPFSSPFREDCAYRSVQISEATFFCRMRGFAGCMDEIAKGTNVSNHLG